MASSAVSRLRYGTLDYSLAHALGRRLIGATRPTGSSKRHSQSARWADTDATLARSSCKQPIQANEPAARQGTASSILVVRRMTPPSLLFSPRYGVVPAGAREGRGDSSLPRYPEIWCISAPRVSRSGRIPPPLRRRKKIGGVADLGFPQLTVRTVAQLEPAGRTG